MANTVLRVFNGKETFIKYFILSRISGKHKLRTLGVIAERHIHLIPMDRKIDIR